MVQGSPNLALSTMHVLSCRVTGPAPPGSTYTFGLTARAPVVHVGAATGPRARVLVCAPSNSALDEVVLRTLKHGLFDQVGCWNAQLGYECDILWVERHGEFCQCRLFTNSLHEAATNWYSMSYLTIKIALQSLIPAWSTWVACHIACCCTGWWPLHPLHHACGCEFSPQCT